MILTKEQARKIMEKDFIEINSSAYLSGVHSIGECVIHCSDGSLYFKPKPATETYPIIFNGHGLTFSVSRAGCIKIYDNCDNYLATVVDSFNALKLAVDKAVEIRNKK